MSRPTVIRLRLRDKENCETSQLLWFGSTSYWERGRPRPHSAEGGQEIDVSYSRTTCSRFALNAGEGARVPGNTSPLQSITPLRRLPVPAMLREFSQQIVREPPNITGRDIGIDVRELAHAGDNRAHHRVAENEAQSHLRHADADFRRNRLESFGALNTWNQVFRDEVDVAPVAFRPLALFGESAGQRAFVERHSGDHRRVHLDAGREKIILRILIEDVVDHLHRINQAALHCAHAIPGLPPIDADADCFNYSSTAKLVHLFRPAIVFGPGILPHMELDQIETIQAGVLQAAMDILVYVFRRKTVVKS